MVGIFNVAYMFIYTIRDYENLAKISSKQFADIWSKISFEPVHEISTNVVCATSQASDQPAHTRSLIRAFARRLNILSVKLLTEYLLEALSLKGGCTCSSESTLVKMPHCWKSNATTHLS